MSKKVRDEATGMVWNRQRTAGEMNNGAKQDAGKIRFSLVSGRALEEIMFVLEHGASKYGADNWKLVPSAKLRYFNAAWRHLVWNWWIRGETHDQESGLHHLAHAGCCLLYLLSFDLGETPEPPAEES